jgi:hypothetical protein
MQNETRRLELSGKILQMGTSLIEEGNSMQDYTITQSGTMMLLLSSLLLSDEDTFLFSEICSMFSAKKILDEVEGIDETEFLNNLMNKRKNELEVKKTKKPRKNKGDGNI